MVRTLGILSFSLYLTQEPVILAFSWRPMPDFHSGWRYPVELALALLVAATFYRRWSGRPTAGETGPARIPRAQPVTVAGT